VTDLPDFETIYRNGRLSQAVPMVPWNIDEPQPAIAELERAGLIRGEVLDAGCGVGETSLLMAERGYTVVGLDVAPSAIATARRQALARGLTVSFDVADLTILTGYDARFDTIVDSGVIHAVGEADEVRRAYLAALARAAAPRAVLVMLCFAYHESVASAHGPALFTEAGLRALVEAHWAIETLQKSTITALLPPERAEAAESLDAHGRALLPAWLLIARRR
jgi:SAM-dependent methyltransferase